MYSPLPPCPWADACIRAALEDGHHARLIYVTPFRDTPSLETLRDLRNVRWRAGGEMIAEKQWGTRRCRRDQNTQTDANRRRQRPWIKSSVKQSTRNWKQRGLGRGRKEGIRKRSLQREAEKTEVEEKRKKEPEEAWSWCLEEEPRQGGTSSLAVRAAGRGFEFWGDRASKGDPFTKLLGIVNWRKKNAAKDEVNVQVTWMPAAPAWQVSRPQAHSSPGLQSAATVFKAT